MLFKESSLLINDRSGAFSIKLIHNYLRKKKLFSTRGDIIKSVIINLERYPRKIRGKRYRPLRSGFIIKCVISISVKQIQKTNLLVMSYSNNCVAFKRRGVLKSNYILGPIIRPLPTKSYVYNFSQLV